MRGASQTSWGIPTQAVGPFGRSVETRVATCVREVAEAHNLVFANTLSPRPPRTTGHATSPASTT